MSGQPNPLDVLRRKPLHRSFKAKDEYEAALAQVETLVEAASRLLEGLETNSEYGAPRYLWAALAPFAGQPEDETP